MVNEIREMLENRQYAPLRAMLLEKEAVDIAHSFDELDEEEMAIVFRLLPKDLAAETFVEMDSDTQEWLIKSFSDRELKDVVDRLYLDDTVDIIEEMPANVVKRILKYASPRMRAGINMVLQYPKDSAGSIMTMEYVSLHPDMTVEEAFARIRETGVNKETIYTCYVANERRELLGIVTVKTLLLSAYADRIESIMETSVIYCTTVDDREQVASMFSRYDMLAMPVVDKEKRLVGIITVDDVVDVIQQEATEDIQKIAGIMPSDTPYLKTSVLEIYKKRVVWLLLLMVSATFTGIIITKYEDALTAFMLAAYIPMLMGTGGNAGSQTATTIIRALSLEEVRPRDILRALWKEIRVALLCGITLAAVCMLKVIFLDGRTPTISLVVSLSVLVTVMVSKLVGCCLPIIAKCIRIDPAVMSSPVMSTCVDAISLSIYFIIATQILGAAI